VYPVQLRFILTPIFTEEPRRSVRATKGQHTKSLDLLDQPAEPTKKRASKKAAKKEEVAAAEEEEIIRCICGVTEQDDESDEDWIACETCSAWQHNVCMGVTTDPALLDSLHYWCEQCKPEDHKELLDGIAQGRKPWEERRRAYEQAELEAQKAKKAKKGKAKRASDHVAEVVQNGKATQVEPPADVKKEKEKEKKEVLGRAGSTKRKAKDDPVEDPAKVCYSPLHKPTVYANQYWEYRPKFAKYQHLSQSLLLRKILLLKVLLREIMFPKMMAQRIYQLPSRDLRESEQVLQS
jgi:hypothetical protein